MYTLSQYLRVLENPDGLCRRLEGMELLYGPNGRPLCEVGSRAVIFRIRLQGRIRRLRCYTSFPAIDLEAVYGDSLLRRELFLHTDDRRGDWVDVVLEEWVEGETLDAAVDRALAGRDTAALMRLSRRFDALAARLLSDDWAHGDLKPENIVVTPDGELVPIDFDARFLPSMQGRPSPELGTPAYQHPSRTVADFDALLDHYPAALIATQLRALAFSPELNDEFPLAGGYLFLPRQILDGTSAAYCEVLDRLAREGDAIHYRIACALRQKSYRLLDVEELFAASQVRPDADEPLEFYMDYGLCGYRNDRRVVIPPVYDEAFEFCGAHTAVRLGAYWHCIDRTGRAVFHYPPCEAVKPPRSGRARFRCRGVWYACDLLPDCRSRESGEEEDAGKREVR